MPYPVPGLILQCHPLTPAPMVSRLSAGVSRSSAGELIISYCLSGDMVRLRIPSPRARGPADGLWQQTCFEAFIAVAGAGAYREFNFSPSGQWAAYAFADYRRPEAHHIVSASPHIDVRVSAGRLELTAVVDAAALPVNATSGTLCIGLSAVVESGDTIDGERSYWALCHPAREPDFHHRGGFVIELPPARPTA